MAEFKLKFDPDALDEWNALDGSVKAELKKALQRRVKNPIVESARLHGNLSTCFKIKSKKTGYRLIYTVIEAEIVVVVIAIAHRDKLRAYKKAEKRI
jgi:mRNA interferase RelE/StbE